MKKFALIVMWLVIISGSVFIYSHYNEIKPVKNTNVELPSIEDIEASLNNEDLDSSTEELITKADLAMKDENYETAIDLYKTALNQEANSIKIITKLSKAYLITHQNENAKNTIELGLQIEKNSQVLNILLTRTLINIDETHTAQEILVELDQNIEEVKYYSGIIECLNNNFEQALVLFQEIENNKNAQHFLKAFDSFSYYSESDIEFQKLLLAKAMSDSGEYEAAIQLTLEIIISKNNYRDAWIVMGYSYLNTNEYNNAINALEQAKDLDPKKPEALFFLGVAYFANEEIDKAITYIEKADEAGYEPKEHIQIKLGDLYSIKENYQKAENEYKKLVQKQSKNIQIYEKIITLDIEHLNKTNEAIKIAESLTKDFPDEALAYTLTGWAYSNSGDYKKAEQYLEKAMEINPDIDKTNLNLAWLYQQQGLTEKAKEYYKKAYILGNGNKISIASAKRFNAITESEKQTFYQVNVTNIK